MRPWLALLLVVLVALNIVCIQAIDVNHDGVDDGPDSDGDGILDKDEENGASFAVPSFPLLLLSVVPIFALRLFGSS